MATIKQQTKRCKNGTVISHTIPEDTGISKNPDRFEKAASTVAFVETDIAVPAPHVVEGKHPATILASEMNKLSIEERERVFEDIHGVSAMVPEDPVFIAECYAKLQIELDKIHHKPAYDLACRINPDYPKRMRLMFLRAEYFNPKVAASNMVTYFEEKRKWFGADKVARDIRLSDLSTSDIEAMQLGYMQILPFRDNAGRAVLLRNSQHDKTLTLEAVSRSSWYQLMVTLQDEETQKYGVVTVAYGLEQEQRRDTRQVYWYGARFFKFMPIRVVSSHVCVPPNVPLPIVSLVLVAAGKDIRAHTRIHQGTHTEWQYSLMTYGVPVQHAPVTYDGAIKTKPILQWIERRRTLEKMMKKGNRSSSPVSGCPVAIELPARYDILIGRGGPLQQHTGNVRFHHFVDKYRDEYMKSSASEKRALAQKIFTLVTQNKDSSDPIRFLERDKAGWWTEIKSNELALKKIVNRLRTKPIAAVTPPAPPVPLPGSLTNEFNAADVLFLTVKNDTMEEENAAASIFVTHPHEGNACDGCFQTNNSGGDNKRAKFN